MWDLLKDHYRYQIFKLIIWFTWNTSNSLRSCYRNSMVFKLCLPVVWWQLQLFAQTGKSYLAEWFTVSHRNQQHTSVWWFLSLATRSLLQETLTAFLLELSSWHVQQAGEVVLTLAPKQPLLLEVHWKGLARCHYAFPETPQSHVCLGAVSNTVGSA